MVVLETISKAPFIKTRLSNKALTHPICTHAHTQWGRVNPGQRNMHSMTGDRLLSRPTTPTDDRGEKKPTKKKKTLHTTLSPSLCWAPVCGRSRNSEGVIWPCLYKHREREKEKRRGSKWETWTRGWMWTRGGEETWCQDGEHEFKWNEYLKFSNFLLFFCEYSLVLLLSTLSAQFRHQRQKAGLHIWLWMRTTVQVCWQPLLGQTKVSEPVRLTRNVDTHSHTQTWNSFSLLVCLVYPQPWIRKWNKTVLLSSSLLFVVYHCKC